MRSQPSLHRASQSGFSLIEVLVAAAILLIISLGVLPMFVRSSNNNVQGQQLTQLIYRTNSEIEEIIQADFTDDMFDLSAGDTFGDPPTNGKETEQLYSRDDKAWYDVADFPSEQEAAYRRFTRVRQFKVNEFQDGTSTADWIAAEGSEFDVDLKEVEVVVVSNETSVFGPSRQLTLRFYKSF